MSSQVWDIEGLLEQIESVYRSENMVEFWPSEQPYIKGALDAISQRLPTRRFTPQSPRAVLGVGGSGIVLRLKDHLFPSIDSALKFPRPVAGKIKLVAEMLSKEMSQLAQLRHPGIVRIVFFGTRPNTEGYGELPFYLMETVDGAKSEKFALNPSVTEEQILALIHDAAEVINYLHTLSDGAVIHLDIKPENIVVDGSGRAVMIDLGTCKQLGVDSKNTIVACTRSFAHPGLVRRLATDPSDEKRAKGEIPRPELAPRWDLWSFGLTMLSWLGIDFHDGSLLRNGIFPRLRPYTRKYLLLLIARTLTDGLPEWMVRRTGLSSDFLRSFPINSSEEICEALRRLTGSLGPLASIPELNVTQTGTIQAAPSQHVANTRRLQLVLDHPLFRRLNGISQLGLVSQVYPGARHTRREHSLGTYANTGRMLKALWDDPVSPLFRQIVTDQDCRDLLLTALLHDIGQFPLAHDFEEIDGKLFDHAELTQAMLRGKWAKKKKGSKDVIFPSLKDVFEAWQTSAERVLSILAAKPTSTNAHPRQKLLRSIISGPIDADKLDYLMRDARHANLTYPMGVDVEMLFRCLTTIVINRVEGAARDVPALGIYAKGKVAAEFLSFSRYAMFSQAYWHHAVRVQKAMLFRAVEALLAEHASEARLMEFLSSFVSMVCGLPDTLYLSPGEMDLFEDARAHQKAELKALGQGTDLSTTDAAVLSWLRERLRELGRPEEALIDGILRRSLFKRLWVITPDMDERRWQKIVNCWDQLPRQKRHLISLEFERAIARRLEAPKSVTSLSSEDASGLIQQRTAGQIPWLLIDVPGARPGSEVGLHCVLESQGRRLRKDDRVVSDLQQSSVWERYARDLRSVAGKVRIFCDASLVDTVDASLELEVGIDDLVGALERLTT